MATKTKVDVQKTEEVSLPPLPKVPKSQIGMRMVYNDGKCADIIENSMIECVVAAEKKAKSDGFNFRRKGHILSWEKIA